MQVVGNFGSLSDAKTMLIHQPHHRFYMFFETPQAETLCCPATTAILSRYSLLQNCTITQPLPDRIKCMGKNGAHNQCNQIYYSMQCDKKAHNPLGIFTYHE